jgi:hypothetical protein
MYQYMDMDEYPAVYVHEPVNEHVHEHVHEHVYEHVHVNIYIKLYKNTYMKTYMKKMCMCNVPIHGYGRISTRRLGGINDTLYSI